MRTSIQPKRSTSARQQEPSASVIRIQDTSMPMQPREVAQFQRMQEAQGSPREQRLQVVQRRRDAEGTFGNDQRVAQQPRENKTGMPNRMLHNVEAMSGYDMSDVRVHYNSDKPAQLQAHAYAQGNQIYLGPGQEKHLGHEAWHVVQQKQGRVRATRQMKVGDSGGERRVGVNDDVGLEREADVMGAETLGGVANSNRFLSTGRNLDVIQKVGFNRFGLEMETKGISIKRNMYRNLFPNQFRLDAGVHTGIPWKIVTDVVRPEFVSEPTNLQGPRNNLQQLLEIIRFGCAQLNRIFVISNIGQHFANYFDTWQASNNRLGDPGITNADRLAFAHQIQYLRDNEIQPFWDLMNNSGYNFFNLHSAHIRHDGNPPANARIVKPQLTFELAIGDQAELMSNIYDDLPASRMLSPLERSREYFNRDGDPARLKTHIIPRETLNKATLVFETFLVNEINAHYDQLGQGLSLNDQLYIESHIKQAILIAALANRPASNNGRPYYLKKKISLMPRVRLNALPDRSGQQVKAHLDMISTRIANSYTNMWVNANPPNVPTDLDIAINPRRNVPRPINERGFEAFIRSTVIGGYNKTLQNGNLVNTDLISGRGAQQQENSGIYSFGALELPQNADGIYEIRSFPFMTILDPDLIFMTCLYKLSKLGLPENLIAGAFNMM